MPVLRQCLSSLSHHVKPRTSQLADSKCTYIFVPTALVSFGVASSNMTYSSCLWKLLTVLCPSTATIFWSNPDVARI